MAARIGGVRLLAPAALALAAVLGVVAGIQPLIALGLAAGVAFTYVVFADLAIGFAILAFLSFLDTLPTSGSLSLDKAAGLVLAVAWLARLSTRTSGEQKGDFFEDHTALTWLMIAFFGWATLTLAWATETSAGVTALSRYLPNLLLLPIAYTAVQSRRDLMVVLVAILIGASLAAIFGILEPPNPAIAEERATGTVGDPNELAAALLAGMSVAVGFILARGLSPALRLAGLLAVPLCAAGVFLSLSRGGLVALGAMLLAGTLLAGRWRLALTGILVLVAAFGVLYFTEIAPLPARERVTMSNGGSGRSDLWKIGLRMVQAHPVGGVGVGNFQVVSPDYVLRPGIVGRADLIFSPEPKIAHNTYLQVLSETGAVGLALFLALVLGCLACTLRAARLWAARENRTMEALARSILLGVIGILAADFFISQMYGKLLWALLALGPALLGLALYEARGSRAGREAMRPA